VLEGPGPEGQARDNPDREGQVPDNPVRAGQTDDPVLDGLTRGRQPLSAVHRSPVVPDGRIRSGPVARSRLIPLEDVARPRSPHP
jgi:hypothetical protein